MNEALIVLVRAIISFFTLLIFARVLGKQQISQLTFFDYIVGITIGGIAANLTTNLTSSAWSHWVGLLVWSCLAITLQFISLKWRKASEYINGKPTILIMNGKILEESMKKVRYTLGDLLEELRDKDIFDLREVAFAVLEKDGKLSVLKKSETLPATRKDLNIKTEPTFVDKELIYDGIVIEQNLNAINKTRKWLNKQLKIKGVNDISEVFIAVYNPNKEMYIDLYKDHTVN
ncbi:DUF421 domain-containing protein [Clostridium aestuarii]|uniref:DUF421 domain-containing protein n=1 Tax=Clostridium aestuarii TaxID=338193 RepID=A0ABT4CWI9_9CLOT|nr:DUF421 domain-containing protein [Clostridium aestuarii]MCY6483359.1 DUF421 domain-containing protein [Clostridium aestuarii]